MKRFQEYVDAQEDPDPNKPLANVGMNDPNAVNQTVRGLRNISNSHDSKEIEAMDIMAKYLKPAIVRLKNERGMSPNDLQLLIKVVTNLLMGKTSMSSFNQPQIGNSMRRDVG